MNSVGKKGEEIAALILREKGYKILARNIRLGKDEIDIVAYKNRTHFLIEVKTASENSTVKPGSQMTMNKRKNFERAAQKYSQTYHVRNYRLVFAEVLLTIDEELISLSMTKYS